jgi:hypothetical protein
MPSSEEMFQHSYRDGLLELELYKVEFEKSQANLPIPPNQSTPHRTHSILLEQYGKVIDEVIQSLKPERPDPELVFRGGYVPSTVLSGSVSCWKTYLRLSRGMTHSRTL